VIREYARREKFSAQQKDELLTALAGQLPVDYDAILSKRLLHIMSPDELKELVAAGVDIQLHTHRHHSPTKRESFMLEVGENREFISQFTKLPHHFCYPYGRYADCFGPWLDECNVVSATTCDPGLATNQSDRFKLPRLIDTSSLKPVELEGWISGFANFLPRRPTYVASEIPPYYY